MKVNRIIVFICLIVCGLFAHAQTITGSVTGVVTDPTGAVIPGAKVTATNISTGVATNTVTNDAGRYDIRFLQIGQYKITVDESGFKAFATQPFTLEVDQVAKIDAKLQTGADTETVTVTSDVQPILDTDSSTITSTFSSNSMVNLPIEGRNLASVTQFLPGALDTSPAGMSGSQNAIERATGPDGQVSVNGNRQEANSYILDGIDINETVSNTIGYNVSPDALENLTVITSNAGAEYGNVAGGDVIQVIKSGTNQFHGSLFGYLENDNLNANSWANNFARVPKQSYTQSTFGATFGGPILKNKLFFFGDYEGIRYHTGGSQAASVIPQAVLNGDFTGLPVTVKHWVAGQGMVAYPDQSKIPVTNPVALFLAAHPELYPAPNQNPTDGYAQNNYIGPYKNDVTNNQADVKIDYTVGPTDTIMGRFTRGVSSDITPETPIAITFPATNDYPFTGFALNWVHTFSPTIVNEARGGWSRVRWDQGIPVDSTGAFGLKGNSVVGISGPQPYPGFALQDFGVNGGTFNQTYLTYIGNPGFGSSLIENNFSYGDDLTMQFGHHDLKAGVQILRYQQNNFYPGNDGVMGRLQYSGAFTGSTVSDFLTDNVWYAGISDYVGRSGQRQYRDAFFFQDDWKFLPNLTLNLGVRYEYDQPIYEVNNKQGNVDLDTGLYYLAGSQGAGSIFGNSRALYNPTYDNFQPRIGFSYQPTTRLVVRGGYGITDFLEGTGANLRLNFNPPFHPVYSNTALPPASDGSNGGSPMQAETALPSDFTSSLASNTYRAWAKHLKPSFTQEYTLSTEYQMDAKTSFVIGYVGQTTQHLVDARAGNQLTAPGADAPYASLVGQSGSVVVTESEAVANYNAAQLQLRRRQAQGLEYTINYTYSKSLTNNPGFFGTPGVSGASAYWQNAYDPHADYGPAGTDVRHNLSATAVYQLPFGRGQKFGATSNWLTDELIGGWKITGTAIAYSGLPVTISGPDTIQVNNRASRANQYRPMKIQNRSIANWWGTDPSAHQAGCATDDAEALGCAYGPTVGNEFGSARVGTERAPGFDQIDFSAGKAFSVYREQKLEFRSEFFNAFNIASYSNPDNGITDSNFGQISNVRGIPRTIQLSLHYTF